MKKIFALALALIMVLGLSTTALAVDYIDGDTIDETSSTAFDMYGRYLGADDQISVISVDISYGAMEFVYTNDETATWDPATHTYTAFTTAAGSWNAQNGSNFLQITNHSNVNVWYKLEAKVAETVNAYVTGFDLVDVTDDENRVAYSDGAMLIAGTVYDEESQSGGYDEADYDKIEVMPLGTMDATQEHFDVIGDVTITIYPYDYTGA